MRTMQIITRVNRGGTARWLDVLISGLESRGNESALLAGLVQGAEIEDEIFNKHSGIHISGLGRSIAFSGDLRSVVEIRRAIKKYRPDLVNTHTSKAGALGRIATIGLGDARPAVMHTFHGHLLYGYFGCFKSRLIITAERILSRVTDLYISSGSIVRNELIAAGISEPTKYVVVKPGIRDLELDSKEFVKKQFGIDSNSVVIGWLGRMASIKRPDRVIEIAHQFPEVIFLVAGDGELLLSLKENAPSNVIFAGWSTPEIIWAASDIALLTSENEAQPISLVESGYAGLPNVAFGVGSVSEVIEHGVTGFVGKTIEEVSAFLLQLIDSPTLREELGKNARTKMIAEFSVDSFITGHIAAYEKAIANTIR